jgi:hypothetical protein
MGQVTAQWRRATNGYAHWCPGCEEMHVIPDGWTFNGNLAAATFTPSVKITDAVDYCCHYNLTAGHLQFHGDSTHSLKGTTVTLPELPDHLKDQEC